MANDILASTVEEGGVMSAIQAAGQSPNAQSEVTLKRKAADLTAIRAATDDTPLKELFEHSLMELQNSEDPDNTIEDYKRLFIADQQSAVLANVTAAIDENPDTLEQAVPVIQGVEELTELYAGKKGTQRAFTDSVGGDLESSLAAQEEVNRYMWGRFNDLIEDKGIMSKVWDGVTTLTGLDFAWDASDLTGVPMIEALGGLDKLVGNYQQMNANEQMDFLEMLIPKVWEAYDENFIKVAAILDLLGDPNYKSETALSGALEAVGIGELVALPIRGIAAVRRAASVTNSLKRAGDATGAATVNKEALDQGIDILDGGKQTQAQNAHIFDYEGTVVGLEGETDGIASETLDISRRIEFEMEEVREQLNDIDFIELTGLSPEEQAAKQKSAIDELQALADGEGKQFSNATIVGKDQDGFTVQYKIDGVDSEHVVQYRRDDVGTWAAEGKEIDPGVANLLGAIFSPEAKLRAVDDSIVGDLTFGGMQASRLRNQLVATAKTLSEGLTGNPLTRKAKRSKLDELLLVGDETSKVFTIKELQTGVSVNGIDKTYAPDEIVAYYKHVNFYRDLGKLRNHSLRKNLVFAGNKTLSFMSKSKGEMQQIIGVPKTWDDVSIPTDEMVLAPQLNKSAKGDYAVIGDTTKLKEDGFEIVELTESRYVNNKRIRYAVMQRDAAHNVYDLPKEIVQYDAGYVPRIRKRGYFYVKEVTDDKRKTVRAFESHSAAQKYAERLTTVQAEKVAAARLGEKATGIEVEKAPTMQFQVFRDGELSPGESVFEQIEATGGSLFTGKRKRDPLLLNEEGIAPERMGALDSLQTYIENVSNIVPMSEYRAGMIQRFKNTLAAVARQQGRSDGGLSDPMDIRSTLTIKSDQVKQSLEQTRDYMVKHLGLMTREETLFGKTMTHFATMMEGKPIIGKPIHNGMMRLAHTDPVAALKGATFNAYLGWFNLRQLYIQAQNASLALSMHPIEGTKATARAVVMRPLMFITDPSVISSKEVAKVIKGSGEDPTGIIKRVQLFRKTGLADAITRTGDYHQMAAGLSGGTWDGMKSLARKGQVFFREGELFSRMITFDVALTRYMKKAGKKNIDDLGDEDIQAISEEALVMNMNMQSENAAAWQNNIITGPATQFLQVQAKLIENLLPVALGGTGKWTGKERAAVLTGQLALYGTLDVPVAEDAVNWLAESTGLTAAEIEEKYTWVSEQINQGIVGVAARLLGVDDVNMSEPASIVAGLDDNVIADLLGGLFAGQGLDFWKAVSGASGGVVKRADDALMNMVTNARLLIEYPELAPDALLDTVDDIASITSTWSNAKKAWHIRSYDGLLSKRGTQKVSLDNVGDLGVMDQLAIGMGFQTDAENAFWDLNGYNYESKGDRRDNLDYMKNAFRDYQVDQDFDKLKKKWHFVLTPYDPVTRTKMVDSFLKSVMSGKSELDKTVQTTIKEYLSNGHTLPFAAAQEVSQPIGE